MMGGTAPPPDILLPKDTMKKIALNPHNFILAIPLAPNYHFSREEVIKLESSIKGPSTDPLDKTTEDTVVVWRGKATKEEPLWWNGRPVESITTAQNPHIMGGKGSFWPLPLQRQGKCTTLMWKVVLPEDFTTTWMGYLGKEISKEWEGYCWTLSKR